MVEGTAVVIRLAGLRSVLRCRPPFPPLLLSSSPPLWVFSNGLSFFFLSSFESLGRLFRLEVAARIPFPTGSSSSSSPQSSLQMLPSLSDLAYGLLVFVVEHGTLLSSTRPINPRLTPHVQNLDRTSALEFATALRRLIPLHSYRIGVASPLGVFLNRASDCGPDRENGLTFHVTDQIILYFYATRKNVEERRDHLPA